MGLLAACAQPAAPAATTAPQATPVKPVAQVPSVPQATAAATKAATAAATTAPAGTKSPTDGIKRGGTLTVGRTASVNDFDPYWLAPSGYPFFRSLYNTPTRYDSQLKPQPELAESWSFAADGKSLTLKLRQGVKFHSGREVVSQDFKNSLEYGSTSDTATMRTMFKAIKAVETPDKYTAVFKTDAPYPGIFDVMDVLFIIDKEAIADKTKSANGTGPFKLDKYIPNDRVEFVANKDYWDKGKPYVDRYVVRQIPDLAALVINLESGAVDFIWQPSYMDLARLKNSGGKFIPDMGAPGAQMFDIALNVKDPNLKNKKVRQAIAWSIDRARFCKTTLAGMVEPTCLMWPRHSWAYFKDMEGKIGYDLDKAKALLKEAGMEGGFETEIMTSAKRAFGYGDLAVMLQADLAKIGIKAKISDLEPTQYDSRSNKGDIQAMVHTYGRLNRDPGSLVTGAKAWYNEKEGGWCHYENAEYDQMRNDLQSTLDQAKRTETCRKIQEKMLDECFTITVGESSRPWAYASYLKGFGYDVDNVPFTMNMWLDK
ncbi:MAG: ABC transporter substrate-binding protein [Chloroflexota bacterium]